MWGKGEEMVEMPARHGACSAKACADARRDSRFLFLPSHPSAPRTDPLHTHHEQTHAHCIPSSVLICPCWLELQQHLLKPSECLGSFGRQPAPSRQSAPSTTSPHRPAL